jgi:hypothetical protein
MVIKLQRSNVKTHLTSKLSLPKTKRRIKRSKKMLKRVTRKMKETKRMRKVKNNPIVLRMTNKWINTKILQILA